MTFSNYKALRMVVPAFALVLTLSLTACATDTETEADLSTTEQLPDTTGVQDDMDQPVSGDVQATPQGTVSLLQQGVTSIAVDQAVANIDGWLTQLDDADDDALDAVADNLEELRSLLQDQPIDGAEVGNLLTELGQQTTDAAANAAGQQMTQLQTLGETLTTAGEQLTGGGM